MRRIGPLKRRAPLRRRRRPLFSDPARLAWTDPQAGWCDVCGRPQWRLHRHHVVYLQHVRREGGDPWALANSMLICAICHAQHHSAYRKISRSKIPPAAVGFAERLLGAERAWDYFGCYYGEEGS